MCGKTKCERVRMLEDETVMNRIQLCCPCINKADLIEVSGGLICSKHSCYHAKHDHSFQIKNDIPIIISEVNTDTVCSSDQSAHYVDRSLSTFEKLRKMVAGESKVTKNNCDRFNQLLCELTDRPKVLVIGGAQKGSGTSAMWQSEKIEITSIDIYASSLTDLVCDAHYLPIQKHSFHGVWVQAVLEHVVEPQKVVSEIYRVLKPNGIVYAETPFMQQVHEGAYDFRRYTVTGHRYLFKDFELVSIGGNKGPELVLAWAIRYFVWGLTRSRQVARVFGLFCGLILRPFEKLMSARSMFDASSGVYFLGRKARKKVNVSHKDIVSLYKGQF